jgi:dinuclear metal center YbgI/SA1388 family protein
MIVKALYDHLCLSFPASLSCEWDRDGLMVCPDPDRIVRRVLVTLDVTPGAVQRAIEGGADVILSHHPLLFRPLPVLTHDHPTADKVMKLLTAGISVLCFHTRADAAPGGVSDLLASAMGLTDVTSAGEDGILRVGRLPHAATAATLAQDVKRALASPAVIVGDAGKEIRVLAVCGGEGKDMVEPALASGADALLVGRAGYHTLLDAAEAGLTVLEAGHWYTEIAVTDLFARLVREACGAEVIPYRHAPVDVY